MELSNDSIYLHANPVPVCHTCGYGDYMEDEYHIRRIIDTYVLIFMTENKLHFTENGVEHTIRPGEVYIQLPHILQDGLRPSPGARYFWIHFSAEHHGGQDGAKILPIETDQLVTSGFPLMLHGTFRLSDYHTLFESLYACRYAPEKYFRYQSIFLSILDQLRKGMSSQDYMNGSVADGVRRFISKHYKEALDVERLEERFGYTYDYIRRIFSDKYDVTPLKYLRLVRIRAAQDMLVNTERSPVDVARLVGFKSEIAFCKAFKGEYGIPPREWRKRMI